MAVKRKKNCECVSLGPIRSDIYIYIISINKKKWWTRNSEHPSSLCQFPWWYLRYRSREYTFFLFPRIFTHFLLSFSLFFYTFILFFPSLFLFLLNIFFFSPRCSTRRAIIATIFSMATGNEPKIKEMRNEKKRKE